MNRLSVAHILFEERLCTFNEVRGEPFKSFMRRPAVSRYLDTEHGKLTFDLTALAAVEFALMRFARPERETGGFDIFSVGPLSRESNKVPLPTRIVPQDGRLAIAACGGTETLPCEMAARIYGGDIRLNDLFLFAGDVEKFRLLTRERFGSLEDALAAFPELLRKEFAEGEELLGDLIGGMCGDYRHLVWTLRLLVLNEAKERGRDESSEVSKEDEMRSAIRHFRSKWDPDEFSFGSPSTTLPPMENPPRGQLYS